jgi:hypothetical protein
MSTSLNFLFFRFQLFKFLWVGNLGAEEETQKEEGEKETLQVAVQVREMSKVAIEIIDGL